MQLFKKIASQVTVYPTFGLLCYLNVGELTSWVCFSPWIPSLICLERKTVGIKFGYNKPFVNIAESPTPSRGGMIMHSVLAPSPDAISSEFSPNDLGGGLLPEVCRDAELYYNFMSPLFVVIFS